MPAQISRRGFVAGALAVAACSRTTAPTSGRVDHIVVANYPLYIDSATNRRFTDATGIDVEYHESPKPESIAGADVAVVSDWLAVRLVGGARPSVPWAVGMVGIGSAPGLAISRFADLFKEELAGRVALPNDMRQSLGIALLADRIGPSTVIYDQAAFTAQRLANSVRIGQVVIADRPSETGADVIVARASDVVATDREFVVPEEGGLKFTDVAVALTDAGQPYLDFVDDPVNAAERYRVLPVMWEPDDRIERLLEHDGLLQDQRRNPRADVRSRLHAFRILTEEDERGFEALFDSVRAAAE